MNLELHAPEMSDEEYVDIIRNKHLRIVRHNNMMWREVAPFFWRPVFHFQKYDDRDIQVPVSFRLGGFQFPVTEESKANSSINFYIFDNKTKYDIRSLSRNKRQELLQAMKFLQVKREYDLSGFVDKTYPVYISFIGRSGYKYRRDRVNYDVYSEWAKRLFKSGKAIILGAYNKNIMVGVLTMVYVKGVAVMLSHFTHSDYLKNRPSDLLFHAVRVIASNLEGVRFIYAGMRSEKKGVNDFKELRGAFLIKAPSYVYMNPVASHALKYFGKRYYRKIEGMV